MKKNKFITAILSIDEWNLIREAMDRYEDYLLDIVALAYDKNLKEHTRKKHEIVYHFNHCAIAKIEELDLLDKKERRKNVRKSKQKDSENITTIKDN